MPDRCFVYIMTNHSRTLYVGVTSDLLRRVQEHRQGVGSRFTSRYRLHTLLYFESYETAREAIEREKQLKGWRRQRKIELIESQNPGWSDQFGLLTP